MQEDEHHTHAETSQKAADAGETPHRSLTSLNADHQAGHAQTAAIIHAEHSEALEDRESQIAIFIIDNGLLENEDVFGAEPLQPDVMRRATQTLLDMEDKARLTDPNYDITGWSQDVARSYLELKSDETNSSELADETEQASRSYSTAINTVRETNPGINNVTLCRILIEQHSSAIPEQHRNRLMAFIQMQQMAVTPQDQAIITAKINALDLGGGLPDPISFVHSEIFSDEAVSDAFCASVAARFDIPNPRIKTGGQVDQTLDARDSEGNPQYTHDNPVEIGEGTHAYVNPDGSRTVRVDVDGGRSREIPWNRNDAPDVIGTKISLAKIWARNEWDGNTDFFGESIDIETDILSQTDPQKLTSVRNLINAIFGGMRGYDGVIIQDSEADYLGWFNQFLARKGDAAQGDFDRDAAITNRTSLGLHPDGDTNKIDYDVLREASLFAKGQYGAGEPDYDALQSHLHERFPEKDIPLPE